MNPRLQSILVELRQRLDALYGPRLVKVILYGSQARGDAEPGSDVDVLVVLRGFVQAGEEIGRTGDAVADLSLRFDEVINCVFVDEKRFVNRNGPFLRNVRREGITV
jgi:predicted nucleotidyltransferase